MDRYPCDLVLDVSEIDASLACRAARFRLKNAFAHEPLGGHTLDEAVVYGEPAFRVSTAVLEHRTPCLAFAMQESAHVNIWKNRLAEMNLPVGPWLQELKRAVSENQPDDYAIETPDGQEMPLERLRHVVTITPGQKITYVTDVADSASNRKAIIDLAKDADILFIEAAFADADMSLARDRAHLTTTAAGEIARAAGVRRVEPFHFSARYEGDEQRMLDEVIAVFGA